MFRNASSGFSPPDNNSCSSSNLSEATTSTVLYDHESFETFKGKARDLLDQLFPNHQPIAVMHMAGGSFHQIVGGILRYDAPDDRREVILRIPRFPYLRPADEVAVLQFLVNHTTIPVPHVLHSDISSKNHIGCPYIVQSRLPGKSIETVYATLPFEKKVTTIRGIARLLKQFSDVTFPVIGMLVADDSDPTGVKVDQAWDFAEDIFPREDDTPRPTAKASSISSFLEERWSFHLEEEERCGPSSRSEIAYITAFRALTEKLQLPDADTPARIVLFHTDFAPRNIFIDEESGGITGVLDWDRAEAAVVEAAWTMPAWLWDRDSCGSDMLAWVDPDLIPSDPTAAKLRDLFVEEIEQLIPGYMNVVRSSKALHELLFFARQGLRSQKLIYRADAFLKNAGVPIPESGQKHF